MHGERIARPRISTTEFVKRTFIVLIVALTPVLIWFMFDVILIVIGAIMIAVLLRIVAEPFGRWGRLPQSISLLLSGLIIVGMVAGAAYLFGSQINTEFTDVYHRASAASAAILAQLQGSQIGKLLLAHLEGGGGFSIPDFLGNVFSISISFLEALVVTVVAGFYLAPSRRFISTVSRSSSRANGAPMSTRRSTDIGQGSEVVADWRVDPDGAHWRVIGISRLADRPAIAARAWRDRRFCRVRSLSRSDHRRGARAPGGDDQKRRCAAVDGGVLSFDPPDRGLSWRR